MAAGIRRSQTLVTEPKPLDRQIKELRAQLAGMRLAAVGGIASLSPKAMDRNFFDTEYLAGTGEQSVRYFVSRTFNANGNPQSGAVKSPEEYNMKEESGFPSGQNYTIYGLKARVMGSIVDGSRPLAESIEMLRAFTIVRFWNGERQWWEAPLHQFSNAGFYGLSNANAAVMAVNFGPSGLIDWHQFGRPFPQLSGLQFTFELVTAPQFATEEDFFRIQLELVGQLSTPQVS